MDVKWEPSKSGEYPKVSASALEKTLTQSIWTGPTTSPVSEVVTMINKGDLKGAKRKLSKMYKIMPGHIILGADYNVFNALTNIIFLEEEKQKETRHRLGTGSRL